MGAGFAVFSSYEHRVLFLPNLWVAAWVLGLRCSVLTICVYRPRPSTRFLVRLATYPSPHPLAPRKGTAERVLEAYMTGEKKPAYAGMGEKKPAEAGLGTCNYRLKPPFRGVWVTPLPSGAGQTARRCRTG